MSYVQKIVSIGSPPQVRGKLRLFYTVLQYCRITPAGAGKTQARREPRQSAPGSPPQVRGKLRYNLAKVIQIRITPAGAGKTPNILPLKRKLGDHPRRCGENQTLKTNRLSTMGSPPQVRGKHSCVCHFFNLLRITPAGAGKTPSHGVSA